MRAAQLNTIKEKVVSFDMTERLADSLRKWLNERGTIATYEQGLFISKQGKRLCVRTIQQGVARAGKAQGLDSLTPKQILKSVRVRSLAAQLLEKSQKSQCFMEKDLIQGKRVSQLLTTYKAIKPETKKDD